jgi:hypothetical protein
MAFWTAVDGQAKDPKRTYRWVLQITSLGTQIGDEETGDTTSSVVWYAKKVDKPNFSLSESEHKYLMHTFYFPGKITWNEITATIVDPSDPDAITGLSNMMEASGYLIPIKPSAPSTAAQKLLYSVGKAKSVTALGAVNLFQIDAEGKVIEHWRLNQAWIKEVKPSALDYDSEDLSTIDIVIRYDWAQLGQAGTTLGATADGLFGIENG